jgi:hypothetical protein
LPKAFPPRANDCGAVAAKVGVMGKTKATPAAHKSGSAPPSHGGDKLRKSVVEKVGKECNRIADALISKTIGGSMVGAKLLVDLTGAKIPSPEPPPPIPQGLTVAQRWAMCPKWEEPLLECEVEDFDPPLPESGAFQP